MSTDYTVVCRSGGKTATIKIIDSINPLPNSDTWEGSQEDWGNYHTGPVANWGTDDLTLSSGMDGSPHKLLKFTGRTKVGDHWHRLQAEPKGKLPDGNFNWECIKKD